MTENDTLLTGEDVAKMLSVSPRTVQGWRQRRKGPPYVVVAGKLIRYRSSQVHEWIEQQSEKA